MTARPAPPTSCRPRRRRTAAAALAVTALTATATACSVSTSSSGSSGGTTTITVATASVPQFDDIRSLTPQFEKDNPGIKVKYVNLPEDQLRDQLTQSVATGSSAFDVVSIGPYEVPIWAKNGWLKEVDQQISADSDYDGDDIIPAVKSGLQYEGKTYAVPISGESSMLMYRKDLFEKAGVTMPDNPTWTQVRELAAKVQDKAAGVAGICLRGGSSWGASLAALNPMITTYGGIWYDESWQPQWASPQVQAALKMYLDLQQNYGIPGAASASFPECLSAFTQGKAAMWFDATSAGASVEDPGTSKVVGKVGYTLPPTEKFTSSGWLWSWNLAMTSTSKNADAAWKYMRWASSKEYIDLVGQKLGWNRAPTATRTSTYEIKDYLDAAPFAKVTLESIKESDPTKHAEPTPYVGSLFLLLPSYQDFGTQIAQQVSAAITGSETAESVGTKADSILTKYADENKKWVEG